jgi:hypothetical protein
MSTTQTAPVAAECPCYKCSGPIREWRDGRMVVVNNVHGRLQPCEECGRAKTEYVDLGRKGVYECWWCNHRTADPGEL